MSDTNLVSIGSAPETSFGVLAASPTFTARRFTSESLVVSKETVTSGEVRPDRQIADLLKVGAGASGNLAFELSALSYEDWLGGAFCNATPLVVSLTTPGGTTITSSTGVVAATPGTFSAILIGSYIRIAGATPSANNGMKLVLAKAGDGSTITCATGSFTANFTGALTVTGTFWRNGTDRLSWTIERGVAAPQTTGPLLDRHWQSFSGMMVSSFALRALRKVIITGEFGFLGRTGALSDTSLVPTGAGVISTTAGASTSTTYTYTVASHPFAVNDVLDVTGFTPSAYNGTYKVTATTGTTVTVAATGNPGAATGFGTLRKAAPDGGVYTAAPATSPMTGSCMTGVVHRNGGVMTDLISEITLNLNNSLRGRDGLFQCENAEVGLGTFNLSGTLNAYFRTNALLQDMLSHTYSSLGFFVQDSGSPARAVGFYMPRVSFATAESPTPGLDGDVMVNLTWQAVRDDTTGMTALLSAA